MSNSLFYYDMFASLRNKNKPTPLFIPPQPIIVGRPFSPRSPSPTLSPTVSPALTPPMTPPPYRPSMCPNAPKKENVNLCTSPNYVPRKLLF